jgi:hypothetical protein
VLGEVPHEGTHSLKHDKGLAAFRK